MRHQLHVVAVVAADVREVEGEMLAAREMLLEGREAAGQRVAARVHDLRVRQHQVNQAKVREVVRHLVDEVGRRRFALHPRLLEITRAQGGELGRAHGREHLGVLRFLRLAAPAAKLASDADDVRQLHGALDLAVRREDLLEQGRARARQADDEDRVRPRIAETGALREKFFCKQSLGARHRGRVLVRVIADQALADAVALRVMAEGRFPFAGVFQRLADRKVEMEAVRVGQVLALELAAHGLEFL